jgi:4-hydroxybenzoate polyprenyltransferase
MRYPLAQNVLSYRSGWIWCAGWFLLALIGSYILNPAILIVDFSAVFLEIAYCLLFKITFWRTVVSGLVKASGPVAAVFVVNPHPPALLLLLQIVWLIFWEIGGQNIPADWNDVAEDQRVHAKTIPLQFGTKKAGRIVIIALTLSVIASLFLPLISPMHFGILYLFASLLAGYFLLLQPGFRLYQSRENYLAGRLFDKASYYPLTQLVLISSFIILFHP